MKGLGILFLVVGILALTYGTMADRSDRSPDWTNPTAFGAEGEGRVSVPSVLGSMALIGGVALVVTGNRRPWRC